MTRAGSRAAPLAAARAAASAAAAALGAGACVSAGCGQPAAGPARAAAAAPRAETRDETRPAAPAAPARPALAGGAGGWLKGSTHVHTVESGDSGEPVDQVLRWYGEHGYDFVVITDHNRVTEAAEVGGAPLVLRGIELTHNPPTCDPPPPEPDGKCRIHVNGVGLAAPAPAPVRAAADLAGAGAAPEREEIQWKAQGTGARADLYRAALDKVRELGGIAQINHPCWHWGVDGDLLAELGRRGAVLVEIANMGFAAWNAGTAAHPSAEAVWDAALSQGVLLYGVASDDAHHYQDAEIAARRAAGKSVYAAGTGWIMVRAPRRADAIRAAIARGDFYATTGVLLERAGPSGGALRVEVSAASQGEHEIAFVGQGGAVLGRARARRADFPLAQAPPGYVRAVVTRGDGARAWVQPVRVPPAPAAPLPR